MQIPDQLTVSYDQNPAMSQAIQDQNLRPGDQIELELHVTIKSLRPEGVDFIIDAVVPEGFEVDEEAEDGATPSDTLMTPAAMLVRKKTP